MDGKMSIIRCTECERPIDTDLEFADENERCQDCCENDFQEQLSYWQPLYQGEKLAGLLSENHYTFLKEKQ